MPKLIVNNGPIKRSRRMPLKFRVLSGDPKLQAAIVEAQRVNLLTAAIEDFRSAWTAHHKLHAEVLQANDDARAVAIKLAAMYAEARKR